jgi:hypothetical protein
MMPTQGHRKNLETRASEKSLHHTDYSGCTIAGSRTVDGCGSSSNTSPLMWRSYTSNPQNKIDNLAISANDSYQRIDGLLAKAVDFPSCPSLCTRIFRSVERVFISSRSKHPVALRRTVE